MIYRIIMDIFFAAGIFFIIIGVLGMLRVQDTLCSLQFSTTILTMGCLPILIGTSIFGFSTGNTIIGFKALIMAFLIILIYPAAAQAFIKAAYKSEAKTSLTMKIDDYGRDKVNE